MVYDSREHLLAVPAQRMQMTYDMSDPIQGIESSFHVRHHELGYDVSFE